MPKIYKFLKLILSVLTCQLAGILGSTLSFNATNSWYPSLNKPFFTPPAWAFGPVWILLYFLMGIALFLIWDNKNYLLAKYKQWALKIFFVQLFFNTLWSLLFFGMKQPLPALIEIIILIISILVTINYFNKVNRTAAFLLVPYLLWTTFAAALNFAIWWLN